jgi:enamine deaminase RidA (YjgF/YER057c/UK114 family)
MAPPIVQTANKAEATPLAATFSDLSIVPVPPGQSTVYLLRTAGQVGMPPPSSSATEMPQSFQEQAQNALQNVAACLVAGGAKPQDITKLTIFVVDLDASARNALIHLITEFFTDEDGHQHRPPSSLVGVAALAMPAFLVEIEADAAIAIQ